jgi:hypothetical protein
LLKGSIIKLGINESIAESIPVEKNPGPAPVRTWISYSSDFSCSICRCIIWLLPENVVGSLFFGNKRAGDIFRLFLLQSLLLIFHATLNPNAGSDDYAISAIQEILRQIINYYSLCF